jgi:hypothetical protein
MLIADAARIAGEVAIYRLRRLEMANIAGAAAICLALALPVGEMAIRLAFAFGLNLLVYLNNDYLDLAADLRAPGRDDIKTRFLRDHRAAGITAQLGLLAMLLGVCAYDARPRRSRWCSAAGSAGPTPRSSRRPPTPTSPR